MTTAIQFRTRISGTGRCIPERILSNADLEKMVDTSDQWIIERTGIRNRHLATAEQATSDLGLIAAREALDAAGLKATDLDMIIFATITADTIMPSASCLLQAKLGARNVMSFDLSAACSGFLYGLSIADQYIRSGAAKNILLVGGEILSRIVDYKDRETCILFGDGAGSVVLSRAKDHEDSAILSTHLHADGGLGGLLTIPAGGSRNPCSQETLDARAHYVKIRGREIFKHAVRAMTHCCEEALEANKMDRSQIDWFIPHQANLRIMDSVAHYFEISSEKVIVTLPETGNTSAATIPTSLDIAVRDGRIKRGQNVLLAAFGGGLTSGSAMVRY